MLFLTLPLVLTSLLASAAPIAPHHSSELAKRQDSVWVGFTGYWPPEGVWKEIVGYNLGWTGGAGEYTLYGTLLYPNYETGLNETNTTVIFENEAISSYIYHFGEIDTYPPESTFQFKIQDASNVDSYDESPALPIVALSSDTESA